ncbi:hypothetical protein NDU88_003601 [Pleurodeles waltl]|uniref:Uncharacterized protein n=1 Tax=Pleurodeles waltl TaxID=8319 RepID=A0AAV7LJ18_PLEWA|nr:hypothetical protein NDU88_003601 [Pleurodeles waltl]
MSGAVLSPAFMWLLVFRGAGALPALPYRSSAAPAGRAVAEEFRPYGPYLLSLGAPRAGVPLIQRCSPRGGIPIRSGELRGPLSLRWQQDKFGPAQSSEFKRPPS